MLALYRSGRQADALAAYRRARETLVEEIGVEPGSELRALQAAMLAQDPALNAPAALSAPLAGGSRVLAGRAAELALLRERLGTGAVVVISGPAGHRQDAARGRARPRCAAQAAQGRLRDHAGRCARRRRPAADARDRRRRGRRRSISEGGDAALVVVLRDGPPARVTRSCSDPLDEDAVAEIAGLYMTPGGRTPPRRPRSPTPPAACRGPCTNRGRVGPRGGAPPARQRPIVRRTSGESA